jgi:hypothetical protein
MERDEMFQMVKKLLTAMQCVDHWRPEMAYNIIGGRRWHDNIIGGRRRHYNIIRGQRRYIISSEAGDGMIISLKAGDGMILSTVSIFETRTKASRGEANGRP